MSGHIEDIVVGTALERQFLQRYPQYARTNAPAQQAAAAPRPATKPAPGPARAATAPTRPAPTPPLPKVDASKQKNIERARVVETNLVNLENELGVLSRDVKGKTSYQRGKEANELKSKIRLLETKLSNLRRFQGVQP